MDYRKEFLNTFDYTEKDVAELPKIICYVEGGCLRTVDSSVSCIILIIDKDDDEIRKVVQEPDEIITDEQFYKSAYKAD